MLWLLGLMRILIWVELGLALAQNLDDGLRRGLGVRVCFGCFVGGHAL